jgi:microcystin-dependent protein
MSEPFIGEIRAVGFNFAPNNWAFCDGSLVAISDNETLFNLLGTTYGGDGQQTFALPDLRGRVAIGQGGNFLPAQLAGEEGIGLNTNQIPPHSHQVNAQSGQGNQVALAGGFPAGSARQTYAASDGSVLAPDSVQPAGSDIPHENRQPLLSVNFVISLFGVFPTQG